MPIQDDSLTTALASITTRYDAAVKEATALDLELSELRRVIKELGLQKQVLEQVMSELAGTSTAASPTAASPVGDAATQSGPVTDWGNLSRTHVVEKAVEVLARMNGAATPDSIQEFLQARNRDDSKDMIGAALAYLNKKTKVRSIGRAQWIPAVEASAPTVTQLLTLEE